MILSNTQVYNLQVAEAIVEYTQCMKDGSKTETCDQYLERRTGKVNLTCKCKVPFELSEDIEKQVYLYYGLSNFYQVCC